MTPQPSMHPLASCYWPTAPTTRRQNKRRILLGGNCNKNFTRSFKIRCASKKMNHLITVTLQEHHWQAPAPASVALSAAHVALPKHTSPCYQSPFKQIRSTAQNIMHHIFAWKGCVATYCCRRRAFGAAARRRRRAGGWSSGRGRVPGHDESVHCDGTVKLKL